MEKVAKVIVSGCFCPQLEIRNILPAGAIWIPTPGGNLGHHDEIPFRLDMIEGQRENDLVVVTAHAPCPTEPIEVATYSSTNSYVQAILNGGVKAVGIFLGSKAVTKINPGGIANPLIDSIYDDVCDLSKSLRKIDKALIKPPTRIKFAPYFESDRPITPGTVYISTLFPLPRRAVDLLKTAWENPPRDYSDSYEARHIVALEEQFS